jgi:kynureninase
MTEPYADSKLIADESGWLMYHSVGRFPGQRQEIAAALAKFADSWYALDDKRWETAAQGRRRAQELWARLVGAVPTFVFASENVTTAFHHFIEALPLARLAGRKVLIAEDCFPSLYFLLTGLAPHLNFAIEIVRAVGNATYVTDDDFIAAWNEKIALAMVNWVSSVASKRADLSRLTAHGHKMGSLVAVDITQGVGVLPLDVAALNVDFAAGTSLKWLCGLPGAGFAYVAPHLLSTLEPRLRGWFSQPVPSSWALDRFSLAPDARRFGHGTPSSLPYLGTLPGLEWVTSHGIDAIAAHNRRLCHRLIEIADAHHLQLASPRADVERGGSVMIILSSEAKAEEARRRLLSLGFVCDVRGNRMRWSPGAVTTPEAMDLFDRALSDVMHALQLDPYGRQKLSAAG